MTTEFIKFSDIEWNKTLFELTKRIFLMKRLNNISQNIPMT